MSKRTTPGPEFASEKELSEFLLSNLNANLTQAIKGTVSVMIKQEMRTLREELNASWQFNGHYGRHLVSPAGKIENIPVPRFRSGNSGLPLQSTAIFAEEKERFLQLVGEMHLAGISQRKINRLCRQLFGKAVAPKTTKTVFAELIEQEAFQVNKTSLMDAPQQFLLLDGLWQKVKSERTGQVEDRVILTALGMDEAGHKQLLGFELAVAEDEASWRKLLDQLTKRGFNLADINLITCDEAKGLLAALDRLIPDTPVQLCLTHRYRNVLKYTPHRHKRAMGADLKQLTASADKEEFVSNVKDMQKRWQTVAPRAVKSLTRTPHLLTAYFAFPPHLWSKLRTTNALERTLREIRSRTVVMQHQFASPQSAINYHRASMGQLNQTYFAN